MNEVSNGPSGNMEYVEFVVVDSNVTYNCAGVSSAPCVDLRGWIFDDNSGYHGTSGIATGCIRFSNDPFWSCIPVGTILLIYNNLDPNTSLPPDDLSMLDGNCKIVAPVSNTTLFESNATTPGALACSYPAAGWTAGGNWNNTLLANTGDCARIVNLSGCEVFSVCWGSANLNTLIYFGGGGGQRVYYFGNTIDNNPSNVANWVNACASPGTCGANLQTPGAPNNAANAAWINNFNNGCAPILPIGAVASFTNSGCICTGAAAVTTTGSIAPYTYTWMPAPGGGQGTSTATGLCAGTYSCFVQSAVGCMDTVIVTIISTGSFSATVSTTSVLCNGGNNGSATVTAAGGTLPYTYTWSPFGGNAATAGSLTAGNYTVLVKDANSCTVTATSIINQPSALTALTAGSNVSCNGGSNGSATVTAAGGTPGYTYTWSPSGGNAATAGSLTAGNYTVLVKDANNCTVTATSIINQPTALTALTTGSNVSCNGGNNGSATVTAAGGTPGYTYTWSPSGGNAATAGSLTAGNYTVLISDANSCTVTATSIINQPTALTALTTSSNVSCNGGNNGSATVTAAGGTLPYTYTWSPSGGNAATAGSLTAGNYTVLVKDANNCTVTATSIINQPTALTALTTGSNVSCNGGNNGSATVTAAGGTPGYTYTWSPSGGNAATAGSLTAGTYTVLVSDANNCTVTATSIINQPTALTALTTGSNVSCNGGNNGSATVTAAGGTLAYTYTWSPSGGNAATAGSLTAGNYTVLISDVNSCTVTATSIINQPSALTALTTGSNVSCNGGNNGSATVTAAGGTPGYTYTWSPSGGNAPTASGLTAGNYTVLVSDVNSCTVTATSIINQPSALTALTIGSNVSCNGGNNGSATVTAAGGTPGYTYTWSPSGGNAATAGSLTAGSYTVLVSDANSCTITATSIINQPTALTAVMAFTNPACSMFNGAASVTVNGGTPAYSYSWSPAGGNTSLASGLSAGSFTLLVTDNNNCTLSTTINLSSPLSPSAIVSSTNVVCAGETNGSAFVTASGGTPGYTYTWSPSGGNSQLASSLGAGAYTVLVKDANNCTVTAVASIQQPAPISAVVSNSNVTCNGLSNGSLLVNVSGGTAGYTYTWSPSGGNNQLAGSLAAGSYTVMIKDANNCTLTAAAVITEPPPLTAVPSATDVLCFGGANGMAGVAAGGGNGSYTYYWTPAGGSSSVATGLSAGNYTVVVSDSNNCTLTTFTSVSQPTAPLTASANISHITCNGLSNGSGSVMVNGGTPVYSYSWSPSGITNPTASSLAGGTHTVYITDLNSCTYSLAAQINEPATITVSVNSISLCSGQNGILAGTANGGTAPYSFFWNNAAGNASLSVSGSNNTYTFHVTDANGCLSAGTTASVSVLPPLSVSVTPGTTVCAGSQLSLSASASGGNGSYQYSWYPGGLSGPTINPIVNSSVVYTVTLSDGCSSPGALATATIVTESIPNATVVSDKYEGCAPLCVSLTNAFTATNQAIQSSIWVFSDGISQSGIQSSRCFDVPGTYMVQNIYSTKLGCVGTATITREIKVYEKPVADFYTSENYVTEFNPQISFQNQSQNATSYLWDFAGLAQSTQVHPAHAFTETGKYLVALVAFNGMCSDTALRVIECLPYFTFYAPNTFTPNEDNINDRFLPLGMGWKTETYSMMIFDRWGELIFSTDKFDAGWNAMYKGTKVKDDVYVWKVSLTDIFGKPHSYIGNVTVIK